MANYYQRFLASVAKWPDQVAVELLHQSADEPADRYTYAELRRMSDGVAQYLLASGVTRGARCIVLAANGPRWLAAFMGILGAGCIVVPLDTAFNPEQVHKLALDSGSVLAFVDEKHRATAEKAAAGIEMRIVSIEGGGQSLSELLSARGGPSVSIPIETADDETAAILYSSGTTGDPKGVMLTHANFSAELDAIYKAFTIGPEDSMLGILPLFHALALVITLLLPLSSGSRILFLESLNTTDLMRALPRVNIFICVPQFFYLIHERIWKEVGARGKTTQRAFRAMLKISYYGRRFGLNLGKVFFGKVHKLLGENMRYVGSGGSKLDPEIGREFEALGFTMLQGYGLTETTGCATYTPPGQVDIGTIGRPLPGMEVKIIASDVVESPEARTHNEGEICIRGGIVMKGYWNRPDATATVLDGEGWLHSGDLGYVDTRGNVHITGRAKDIIVTSSGKNIYPEEIEKHYLKTPYIKELCVVGMQSAPGEPYAERLYGVVVPNVEVMKERRIVNMREVIRYEIENLSTQLPSTKRILSYEIWQDELPRTTTRKIKRFEVERRVRENQISAASQQGGEISPIRKLTEEDQEWLEQADVQRAIAVVREAAKVKKDNIHPKDNLELDLGLDSMERVELVVAVERELGGHVEDGAVSEIYTVGELIDAVRTAGSADHATERPAWDAVLQVEPDDPAVLNVIKPHGFATRTVFMGTRLLNMLVRDFSSLQVEGLENLPKQGPFIVCPNHQSYLDGPVLMGSLPWNIFTDMFYVGTSDIFGQGIWRKIGTALKLIPVDPDANLVPAMRAGAYGLRHGKTLLLFPEGERSINGVPKTFKKGAAILATHLNVPIVPVALDGFYESWPRNRKFKRLAPMRVRFGEPIYPAADEKNPEASYDNITRELKNRVTEMWEEIHDELYPEEKETRVPVVR